MEVRDKEVACVEVFEGSFEGVVTAIGTVSFRILPGMREQELGVGKENGGRKEDFEPVLSPVLVYLRLQFLEELVPKRLQKSLDHDLVELGVHDGCDGYFPKPRVLFVFNYLDVQRVISTDSPIIFYYPRSSKEVDCFSYCRCRFECGISSCFVDYFPGDFITRHP